MLSEQAMLLTMLVDFGRIFDSLIYEVLGLDCQGPFVATNAE